MCDEVSPVINCIQVRVDQLMTYLVEMKSDGYTLIGAEQTVGGRSLRHFPFPRKTVLVLGYESLEVCWHGRFLPTVIIILTDIVSQL